MIARRIAAVTCLVVLGLLAAAGVRTAASAARGGASQEVRGGSPLFTYGMLYSAPEVRNT